ncbi:MAG TPA: hypothetical protein VFZ22_06865, partial [Pyrinomonadaceae bacterium]|nr:hypothetical protein [Pyrinomonadaceae bacterium]
GFHLFQVRQRVKRAHNKGPAAEKVNAQAALSVSRKGAKPQRKTAISSCCPCVFAPLRENLFLSK